MLDSRQHQSDLDSPPPKSYVRATPISHYHDLTPPNEGELSDADVEKALRIAEVDPRVARLLDRGKHVAIGGTRPSPIGQAQSHVKYVFYSYPLAVAIEALVNLEAGRVDRVEERQYQPALTAEEMARAVLLASKDHRIAQRVEKERLYGAGILVSPLRPGDPLDRRVVDVRFRTETHRRPLLYAFVDVAEDRVLEAGAIEVKEHRHAK